MASPESYNTPCLLGAMDRLWFQRIVLFSEPKSSNKLPDSSSPESPSSSSSSSSNSYYTDCSDDDTLGVHESFPSTIFPLPQNKNVGEHEEDKNEIREEEKREEEEDVTELIRPTRQRNLITKGTPIRRRMKRRIKLERTVSCKTAVELEEQEVKGFIDLGFNFEKDRITPKMMSVVPGLQQRLAGEEEEEEEEEGRRKPYLSEAWVIKRPESPLLRLRMPRGVSTASNDMKKHLKLWAKTVVYSAVGDE